ncbi:MAG: DM13 domain-containing protein [Actinomycetota bacterium]|nr:DM13 domain-containing protein [Actinomycetota bacterium]
MASRIDPLPWWTRLLQALPLLAGLATFGVFFVDKNREARTVLQSGRGILATAAVVVGYVVIAVVLRRYVGWAWLPPLVLTGVVLALAAWIVRPYYVDTTADRQLVTGPVTTAPTEAPSPAGPVPVSTGTLQGLGHDASGSVSLIRKPDGSLIVRLENFAIEGVPDPQLYLARGADVRRASGVALGRLQANRGRVFDYAVPAGTDAAAGWTVLVWCRAFSVPVANATQA